MGRHVNHKFEEAVKRRLVYMVISKDPDDTTRTKKCVLATCAYSWCIVKMAGALEQRVGPWKHDKSVMALKFSCMWVQGFLKRNLLRQRHNTAVTKTNRPPVPVVAARMREIQSVIRAGPQPAIGPRRELVG